MALFNFNAAEVEAQAPATEKTLLPEGFYNVTITNTEVKETKSGTGSYVRTEYTILDGDHAKRKVWGNFNIRNENPKAEQIGKSQLASACHAMGINVISDTSELHNKPLKIKLSVRKSDEYGDQNEVKGFAKADIGVAMPTASTSTISATAKAATPPWAKK